MAEWEEEIGGGLGEWVITAPGGEEMVLQMATNLRLIMVTSG